LNSPEYQVSLSAALLSINREDGQQLDVEHSLIPTQTSANSAKVPSDGSQNTSLAQQSSSIEFAPPVANQVTRNADGYSKAIQDGRDIDGMISDSNFVATRKPSARLLAEEEFTNIFGI
jgi:hypothetical protein